MKINMNFEILPYDILFLILDKFDDFLTFIKFKQVCKFFHHLNKAYGETYLILPEYVWVYVNHNQPTKHIDYYGIKFLSLKLNKSLHSNHVNEIHRIELYSGSCLEKIKTLSVKIPDNKYEYGLHRHLGENVNNNFWLFNKRIDGDCQDSELYVGKNMFKYLSPPECCDILSMTDHNCERSKWFTELISALIEIDKTAPFIFRGAEYDSVPATSTHSTRSVFIKTYESDTRITLVQYYYYFLGYNLSHRITYECYKIPVQEILRNGSINLTK